MAEQPTNVHLNPIKVNLVSEGSTAAYLVCNCGTMTKTFALQGQVTK